MSTSEENPVVPTDQVQDDTVVKSKNNKEWLLIALLIVTIIGTTFASFFYTVNKFEAKIDIALEPLDSVYQLNRPVLKKNSVLSEADTSLLLSKVAIIQENKRHHRIMFTSLYANYYGIVTLFPFLTGFALILSFLIAQKGWSDSKPFIKSLFLTFTTLASLFGLFPTIYQQKETSTQNLNAYLDYNKIQKQIFDYPLTAKKIYSDSLEFKDFLNKINKAEYDVGDIYYGLEQRSIGKDLFKQFENGQ